MDSKGKPRNVAKEQYAAMRQSLVTLEERVAGRYWDKNAPIRTGFGRLLGSLDRVADWLFADDDTSRTGQVLPLRVESLESAEADRSAVAEEPPAAPEETVPVPDEPLAGTVEVTFTLPAEVEAESVALCGEFNDWSTDGIQLERGADGTWRTNVPLEPGRSYRYRFLLDGERWENAWQADSYAPNPYGDVDSVVVVGPLPAD